MWFQTSWGSTGCDYVTSNMSSLFIIGWNSNWPGPETATPHLQFVIYGLMLKGELNSFIALEFKMRKLKSMFGSEIKFSGISWSRFWVKGIIVSRTFGKKSSEGAEIMRKPPSRSKIERWEQIQRESEMSWDRKHWAH